ncbi:MAG: hypothetical protein DMF64_12500 [Acidobacteria bacterium]|nr:MAG: hypothetical protein DMF64_12500 [Acidobacteriota bacterium]
MNCPRCQREVEDGQLYCSSCGLSLAADTKETELLPALDNSFKTVASDPLIGRVLDAKYELLAPLGAGGMGTVYRARRVHIGDEVAVKVLSPQYVSSRESVERFRREARAAALLRHPNVVTIHDFGEPRGDDAPAYIVMELVEGRSLKSLLIEEGGLAPERAVALMQGICAGVGMAHRRNVIHRDLKPDNIIVIPPDREDERETVKVIDFGIAKLRDTEATATLTIAGTVLGTPHYMSPEQCRGETLDARADVYSLGAIFYEMLVGTPPFTGPTITSVVAKHLTEPPPRLATDLHVAPALETVCMRALVKRAAGRYQSVEVFYKALVGALAASGAETTVERSRAAYVGRAGAQTTAQPQATIAAPTATASSPLAAMRRAQDAIANEVQSGAAPAMQSGGGLVNAVPNDARVGVGLVRLRKYALGGAAVVFLLSIGLGFGARWLGWTVRPYAYDEFVLELVTIALRDALFGAFAGLIIYEWRQIAPRWPATADRRAESLITHGALVAGLLMMPFVLLRTSFIVLPLTLALTGFVAGLIIYAARLGARKVATRR